MRKVFDGRMVAHVWAQQSQSEGRNNNDQFYFSGATIYSYGSHFPVARIETAANGAKCVLFTTRNYSVTTAKHKGYARNAIHHLPIFFVRDPSSGNVRYEFEAAIESATQAAIAEKTEGRRNHEKRALAHLASAAHAAEKANEYAELMGAKWRLKVPGVDAATIEKAVKAKAKAVAAAAKQAAARLAARDAEQAENRKAWLAGGDVYCGSFDAACGGAALRIVGDTLETSHGARVPLAHAVKAFRFIKLVRERAEGWQHNGHSLRVGHFTVDSIAPDGSFRAGCHDIRWPEVERVAILAGVFDEMADDAALTLTSHAA